MHKLLINISGQTKKIFGRNNETETRLPGKVEISAETGYFGFGRNFILANKAVLAVVFIMKCAAKIGQNKVF